MMIQSSDDMCVSIYLRSRNILIDFGNDFLYELSAFDLIGLGFNSNFCPEGNYFLIDVYLLEIETFSISKLEDFV
jgi:hypothetical protein